MLLHTNSVSMCLSDAHVQNSLEVTSPPVLLPTVFFFFFLNTVNSDILFHILLFAIFIVGKHAFLDSAFVNCHIKRVALCFGSLVHNSQCHRGGR